MTIFRFRIVCLFGLVAACLVATTGTAATLKIATLSPEGSGWMKALREAGARIEERTGGAVNFKFYPGGVMGDDKAVLRKMRVGQLHGAVVTSGGMLNVYKDIAVYAMPMLFRNQEEIDYVRERFDDKLMQGLRENDYVGFGLAEVGFAYPMSRHKITSVAALRERRVWTPDNDPSSLQAFQAFDVSPIPLPIADVLAGLQTGLIDSIASPPIGAIALQWFTQVDYAVELPVLYVYGLMAIARRPFEKLSPEQQSVVEEELRRGIEAVDTGAREDHNDATAVISKAGIEWIGPTDQESQEWQELARVARERMVAEGWITQAAFDEVMGYLNEYRARQ